ncbi:MAG: glycerophosphodiester phosphodiesterase family protein [Bacteroidetes bacterium]|uniref:Glycerophosphodiester phosphodiesterase family protein n=1 Tax=Candidatus Cryptobacteroides merdigallinarum TaxID=2840770 RepID=A0A9D9EHF7_9BACT|nr:glycerophosphodiester phosphodiesterase family protein [Candidatus Cryptobacteroides merdigallinarum]
MKKESIFIILFVLLAVVGCKDSGHHSDQLSRSEVLRSRLLSGDTSSVFVVAHRGDWRYAPENSIAAIKHSIEVGVDIVELDLQMTKDSVLIIMHDSKLDRTTTGKGKVEEWPLDSIRTLKLKNGCGIRTKHTVPTLEEAMLSAKGHVLVNLDKADRYFDLVMPVLEKTGTVRQVIMKGSLPASDVISFYGKYLDKVIYMPVVNLDKDNASEMMTDYMNDLKPAAYELVYADGKTDSLPLQMRTALKGQALIWYNTLWDTLCGGHDDDLALEDPDAAFGYLIDTLGARIIQTDRSEYLLNYLRARNLHE